MSKKYYKLIAQALDRARRLSVLEPSDFPEFSKGKVRAWRAVVEEIALMLSEENDRFDYDKFYQACGYVREN